MVSSKKAVIVGLFFQHAHAALGEKGIVTGKVGLGDEVIFFARGSLEGTGKDRSSRFLR